MGEEMKKGVMRWSDRVYRGIFSLGLFDDLSDDLLVVLFFTSPRHVLGKVSGQHFGPKRLQDERSPASAVLSTTG